MKESNEATFNGLVEAMRLNQPGTFIELVNSCDDLFGHDADGHSLMWHARQSTNPIFAETLDLLASGKEFTEETVQPQPLAPESEPFPTPSASDSESVVPESAPAPEPSVHEPEPVSEPEATEHAPLLQQLKNSLLHCDFLGDEEKTKLSSIPLTKLCSYVAQNNILHQAAEAGCLPICEQLLGAGIPVDSPHTDDKSTALQKASWKRHLHVCEFLLQQGASVAAKDWKGYTALHNAAWACATDICELLLNHGADVNARSDRNRNTPLHFAESAIVCELLLKHGAEVNAKNADGQTPLHRAAEEASPAVCSVLLNNGAAVNAMDDHGCSPLFVAASEGAADVCRVLLNNGADVHTRNFDGRTPLHAAAPLHEADVCALLLEHGADVNARDNQGNTPLHRTLKCIRHVKFGDFSEGIAFEPFFYARENFRVLCSHGASCFTKNNEGRMALLPILNRKCVIITSIMGGVLCSIVGGIICLLSLSEIMPFEEGFEVLILILEVLLALGMLLGYCISVTVAHTKGW